MEFLEHMWNVLGYDTSDGAPPIWEQFNERHKDVLNREQPEPEPHISFENLPIEEKRKRWREYNKIRHMKKVKKRFK